MTEKRFEAVVDGFIDNKTGRRLTVWLEILRILNELADENEQLKSRVNDLEDLNRIYVDFMVSKGYELSDVME